MKHYTETCMYIKDKCWKIAKKKIKEYPYILNIFDLFGNNILHLAIKNECSVDFIDFLNYFYCDFNQKNVLTNESPLSMSDGNEPVYLELQKYGAKLTPFELALDIIFNDIGVFQLETLFVTEPQLAYEKRNGRTILHEVVTWPAHIRYIEVLCKYIDICSVAYNIYDGTQSVLGCIPKIRYDIHDNFYVLWKFLSERGAKMLPIEELAISIWNHDIKSINNILSQNPFLTHGYDGTRTMLHLVVDSFCTHNDTDIIIEIIKILLMKNFYIDAPERLWGQSALFNTGCSNKIAEFLLSHGSNPDVTDEQGNTPLHKIMTDIKLDWPDAVIKSCKNINTINNKFETPYDCMKKYTYHENMLKKFRKIGGKPFSEL